MFLCKIKSESATGYTGLVSWFQHTVAALCQPSAGYVWLRLCLTVRPMFRLLVFTAWAIFQVRTCNLTVQFVVSVKSLPCNGGFQLPSVISIFLSVCVCSGKLYILVTGLVLKVATNSKVGMTMNKHLYILDILISQPIICLTVFIIGHLNFLDALTKQLGIGWTVSATEHLNIFDILTNQPWMD